MVINGNDEQHKYKAGQDNRAPVPNLLTTHQHARTSVFELGWPADHEVRALPPGGWNSIVDNYQRAVELAGLVSDLLTGASFPNATDARSPRPSPT